MSRRDTIIVAALVNAGLLIVLFVSALKNEDTADRVVIETKTSAGAANEAIVSVESKKMIGDEVDLVLKQYSQQDPLQSPIPVAATSNAPNFVEDLQGITQTSSPVSVASEMNFATSSPATVKEESISWIEVKVKKGDMLEKLARQHKTTVSEIMKVNHLTSTQLKIGQVLKISSKEGGVNPTPVVKSADVMEVAPSKVYTVKPGDSPWTIAVKNHMKVEELLKLNNMSEEKARKLKPGDQIRIR